MSPPNRPSPADERPETSTEPLARRFLEGESEATHRLYERLAAALRPTIGRHPLFAAVRRRWTEEDVLGELWLSVLSRKTLERFEDRGSGSLRAYLKRCVDRVLLDILKAEHTLKRGGDESAASLDRTGPVARAVQAVPSAEPGASSVFHTKEWTRRCADRLEERERLVWDLRVRSGLEFSEIAEREGGTAAAVRGVFHRAVKRLVTEGLVDVPE